MRRCSSDSSAVVSEACWYQGLCRAKIAYKLAAKSIRQNFGRELEKRSTRLLGQNRHHYHSSLEPSTVHMIPDLTSAT